MCRRAHRPAPLTERKAEAACQRYGNRRAFEALPFRPFSSTSSMSDAMKRQMWVIVAAVALWLAPGLGAWVSRGTASPRWATCPAAAFRSSAYGVSGDGSVVVGCSGLRLGRRGLPLDERRRDGRPGRPARRQLRERRQRRQRRRLGRRRLRQAPPRAARPSAGRPAAGWSAWATCPAAASDSAACGVSGDGSVVVGYGSIVRLGPPRRSAGRPAAAWSAWATCPAAFSQARPMASAATARSSSASATSRLGRRGLPLDERRRHGRPGRPARRRLRSGAYGVSGDGSVVVGYGRTPPRATRRSAGRPTAAWSASGDLPGGSFDSYALGVSGDGSVVVGYERRPTSARRGVPLDERRRHGAAVGRARRPGRRPGRRRVDES